MTLPSLSRRKKNETDWTPAPSLNHLSLTQRQGKAILWSRGFALSYFFFFNSKRGKAILRSVSSLCFSSRLKDSTRVILILHSYTYWFKHSLGKAASLTSFPSVGLFAPSLTFSFPILPDWTVKGFHCLNLDLLINLIEQRVAPVKEWKRKKKTILSLDQAANELTLPFSLSKDEGWRTDFNERNYPYYHLWSDEVTRSEPLLKVWKVKEPTFFSSLSVAFGSSYVWFWYSIIPVVDYFFLCLTFLPSFIHSCV